jgi:glycosyltransferase involved in cell wall biosynthesis
MKILFLSQLVPYPADAGPKARSYRVLQYLAGAGHDVTLVAFRRDEDKEENITCLKQYCSAVHTVLMRRSSLRDAWSLIYSQLSGIPFLIYRDNVAAMHQLLGKLLTQQTFDAVHADQLWMAQYALSLKLQTGQQACLQTVLDQHNAVFLIPQRLAADARNPIKRAILNLESQRLARYEAALCRQFDQVVWVTKEDQAAVQQQMSSSNFSAANERVIPICIDPRENQVILRQKRPCRVTFLGGLHWPPNAQGILWFARHIFPQVIAAVPDAVLTVIGKHPPIGLTGEGIEVTGYIRDLQPLLAETGAFIVPLQAGGGMRVKILDAWSWGLPVVSTTIGAEGIAVEHEKNILIADEAKAFAQATIRLLTEPSVAEQVALNGRQTVLEKYDWQKTYAAWNDIYCRTATT